MESLCGALVQLDTTGEPSAKLVALTWDMKIMKVAGGKCKPGKMFLACDDFSEAVLFAFSSAVLGASRSFFDVDPEW